MGIPKMAIFSDGDPHLRRLVADTIHWQEMLERLVELRHEAAGSDHDAVPAAAKQDWPQLAENARQHAIEHTDLDTKQALLELAESYDKLAQRDADPDR
jgi:hypothetical protein